MRNMEKIEQHISQLTGHPAEDIRAIRELIIPLMFGKEPLLQKHYVLKISQKAGIEPEIILELMSEVLEEMKEDDGFNDPDIQEAALNFGKDPQIFRKSIDIVNELGIVGNRQAIGQVHVAVISRLKSEKSDSESFAAKCGGIQGTGKSELVKKCLKLQVEDATFIRITDATEKSLYYFGDNLKNKCLYLDEAEKLKGDNGFAYAIRSLISEGCLKRNLVENRSGVRSLVQYSVEGPISFLTTTAHERLEKQLEDRMFSIRPEGSSDQVKRNLQCKFEKAAGTKRQVDERIVMAWQVYAMSLTPYEVIIPFADKIFRPGAFLPVSANRAYGRVISAINAVALFHQKQRLTDKSGRLFAEMPDYAIVYQLYQDSLLESIGLGCINTDPKLKIINSEKKITLSKLAGLLNVTKAAVSKWAKRQVVDGILNWCDENGVSFEEDELLAKAKNKGQAYLQLTQIPGLPSPFELTGDPAWNKGGRLYEMVNLHLDLSGMFIDSSDPMPLGVRVMKRENVDINVEPECYDLGVGSGLDDYNLLSIN